MKYRVSQIPLGGGAQSFGLVIKEVTYLVRVVYANVPEGGWLLDLNDELGNSIVAGIPLVTGANLLGQYGYLGLSAALIVQSSDGRNSVPTYDNLGSSANLYMVTEV